jgi:hypothetical protein
MSGRASGWRMLVATAMLVASGARSSGPVSAQQLSPTEIKRLEDGFTSRALPEASLRNVDAYERLVRAVPVILDSEGLASGYVVGREGRSTLIITNDHAVGKPFRRDSGKATVLAVFYNSELARRAFESERMQQCKSVKSAWCEAFSKSVRRGEILATDRARDLALLRVADSPAGADPLEHSQVAEVLPQMSIAVVGHPQSFVWTITPGTVVAVPRIIPWRGREIEMIQTAASIHHGNSGGPMLTLDGKVVGVVAGGPGETLNFGIAISEVERFLRQNVSASAQRAAGRPKALPKEVDKASSQGTTLKADELGARVTEARAKQDVVALVSLAALLRRAPDAAAHRVAAQENPEALLDVATGIIRQRGAPVDVVQAVVRGYEELGKGEKASEARRLSSPKQRVCGYDYIWICDAWGVCRYAYRWVCW